MRKLERPRLTRAWAWEGDRFVEEKPLTISLQALFFICALLKIQILGSGNLFDLS